MAGSVGTAEDFGGMGPVSPGRSVAARLGGSVGAARGVGLGSSPEQETKLVMNNTMIAAVR